MTANINPDTGIAYGYISANCLDQDIITQLLDDGEDHTAQIAYAKWKIAQIEELLNDNETLSREEAEEDVDGYSHEFWDTYEDYEPIIEGCKDGVSYCSSWLGGALNFFIFESPYITSKARLASPCVPNAGILDVLDGKVSSYNTPDSWRRIDD